ncbi:MAG: alanine--tRNA ligase [Ignavibacteriaceae bacterium]|nr:alanine--tRNA ligase [Ignavibacteriaceae bacterium]
MTSSEIRNQFLNFFKSKEHKIVASAPVVPFDDPTLLFTNAGMNQFKDVFLGKGNRDYTRAVDTQKCIRVSGKHNDLEEVGHDTYHHTFFEMLGNWSFGDYYKTEAIEWAWELLTAVWKLPKERLWATVYKDDNEAFELWKTKTDINPKHILKFGEKDNFWEMGETGPCGPCSEIHINVGDDYENPDYVNAGTPECIEIWNLVFIQYNRDENGKLHDLPAKHVDTGMGFERICAVLQNKKSNYDTDIFHPVIAEIVKLSKIKIEKNLSEEALEKSEEINIPMRVIADHIRALTFAIADGAVPGNEGRGYVLRRILRRAARYGRKINLTEPFLYQLADVLVQTMGDVFPEIKEKQEYVKRVIKGEEESFNATLDRGIELFEEIIEKLNKKKEKLIPGEDVFKLYDTFGFPVDLTNIMAIEKGFSIDEVRFNELMNQQKDRAREASKEKFASVNVSINDTKGFQFSSTDPTEFTGYDELKTKSKITGFKRDSNSDLVILDKSPFYVEAGGQVDDAGSLIFDEAKFNVVDLLKVENKIIHVVENDSQKMLQPDINLIAEVDSKYRWDVMRNHSVTHFLHAALRNILGTHVHQAGSYVGPDHLRFDFTHFTKPSPEELRDIEILVNEQLRRNLPMIHHRDIPFDEAKKMGALMFFGDKYGNKVNVVQFGDFTMEFCGGTHVKNSSEIGLFKITSEASIASGVRRIEAVTGAGVEKYIQSQLEHMNQFSHRIDELLDTKKKLEKEISDLKLKDSLGQLDHILSLHSVEKGIKIYKGKVQADNMDELKSFGDELRNRMGSGVGVLISQIEDKVGIVAVVSDDLIKEKKLSAGKIVGELAKLVGGGGGGRPHLATAGGKDVSGITVAIGKVEKIVGSFI